MCPGATPTASITARMSSIRWSIDGGLVDRIGHARAALVEHDQPRERGQPAQKMGQPRFLPGHLHMRDEPRHQNQVGGSVTNNLIRDADPTALRVPRLTLHHSALQPRSARPATPTTVEPDTLNGTDQPPASAPALGVRWGLRGSGRRLSHRTSPPQHLIGAIIWLDVPFGPNFVSGVSADIGPRRRRRGHLRCLTVCWETEL